MVRLTFLTILLLLGTLQSAYSQTDYANGPQVTGMVQLGLPQNEFAEAYKGNPTGFGASIHFPVGKAQLIQFGGEYAWNSMGRERQQVDIEDKDGGTYAGRITVSSQAQSYHANMRFSPFQGPFRLYFDVFFGMRVYTTNNEIDVQQSENVELTTTERLNNESTNSYGFAGGLMLGLSQNFFLDFKMQSLRGGEVRYVDSESLEITENGFVDYEIKRTATDMFVPQVGLSIVF